LTERRGPKGRGVFPRAAATALKRRAFEPVTASPASPALESAIASRIDPCRVVLL
jgi:hypothetical protein